MSMAVEGAFWSNAVAETRNEREIELRALGMSNAGHRELLRIYRTSQGMENGDALPPGTLIITSILDAEFGPPVSESGIPA
jgi:hypothetical protein